MQSTQIIVGSLVAVGCIFAATYVYAVQKKDNLFPKDILDIGKENPPLWVYVNNSDVNSRYWKDFGQRSSRVMNLPFLNLCYETIMRQNGTKFRVEVIGGLSDLAVRMGGWDALPTPLQNPDTVVNEPELNWIRAAVLAKWGGLWVSPATVWLRPVGELPKDKVVFFGTDDDVTFVGRGGTEVPSLRVIWSPIPGAPVFTSWEAKARHRLETHAGGSEFRHDEKADAADALAEQRSSIEVRPMAELTRKGVAGRRIQLEDLLAGGQDGEFALKIDRESVYLPIPWPELEKRRNFGWFLRMSEDQILESDLAMSVLLRRALGN